MPAPSPALLVPEKLTRGALSVPFTGKQLFQKDKSLWNSDALLADEDAVEVDWSQYSREERNQEEEKEDTGVLYDSD